MNCAWPAVLGTSSEWMSPSGWRGSFWPDQLQPASGSEARNEITRLSRYGGRPRGPALSRQCRVARRRAARVAAPSRREWVR